jgi:formylglycine-generating enzyme required for sulfatase activity
MRAKDGRIFDVQPAQPAPAAPQSAPLSVAPDPTPPVETPIKLPPQVAPPLREAVPLSRPALTAPPANVAIPHIVKGAAPLAFDWRWIPGGKFKMGSEIYDDEKPIHEVDVAGFWLARYPVTNEQFQLFLEAGGYNQQQWWTEAGWQARQQEKWSKPRFWDNQKWNKPWQPVVGISWYEAIAFCAWAASATGEKIRLPSEAEWEKGARGTDGRTFPWGEAEPTEKLCNFNWNVNVGQTTPVGQYSPQGDTPYGCADMTGNVREWCLSRPKPYPYEESDGRNNNEGRNVRVVRGGSWHDDRDIVRCARRRNLGPGNRKRTVGFRCVSAAF